MDICHQWSKWLGPKLYLYMYLKIDYLFQGEAAVVFKKINLLILKKLDNMNWYKFDLG